MTHQDLIDAARDLIEEPSQSEIRDTSTLIRFGGEGDRFLVQTLPREFIGDFRGVKTWTGTTVSTYVFTSTDYFSGMIDALEIRWTTASTTSRPARRVGVEERAAMRAGFFIHVNQDSPAFFVEGLTLEAFPAPANAYGQVSAYYRKTTTATWSATLTVTWTFDEMAFDAAVFDMVFRAQCLLGYTTAKVWEHKRNLEVLRLWGEAGRSPPPHILAILGPAPPEGG